MSGILVVGAGGHAKVVADILLCSSTPVKGFLDDDPSLWNTKVLGLPVLASIDGYAGYNPDGLVMGIGSNRVRQSIVERLGTTTQHLWQIAIHPRAIIASSARIGQGTVVMAGAVINPDTSLGEHTIINTGATIDHDCTIDDYVHIAPGANLAGEVSVGMGALIGVGSAVMPGLSIGRWAVIGAGAVVVRSVPDSVTAKGTPARW